MIDINSGKIFFDDFVIDGFVSLERIKSFVCGGFPSSNIGGAQLSLGVHVKDGERWGVGVIFNNFKLYQVWLQQLSAPGVDGNAWSLDNEKKRKSAHDKIVADLCAKKCISIKSLSEIECKFQWGSISSLLDLKGVQALLVIEYV